MKTKYIIVLLFCFFASNIANYVFANEESNFYDLGRIVIVNRVGKPEGDLSSDVTVIDEERIDESNARNVADLLKGEVGINVSGYSSTRKNVQLDIRGFGESSVSNVLVLVDGRRVTQIDISGTDWWQIPVGSIKRIEVLRGAGSVLYGDNAVGGVINIVTKKGEGKINGFLKSEIASYSTTSNEAQVSGVLDDFTYYLYSRYYDTDGYRANNTLLSKDFNTRMTYAPYEHLELDLSAGHHKDSYGLPGPLSVANLAALGRRGTAYPDDRGHTTDKYIRLKIDSYPEIDGVKFGNFITDFSFRHRDSYSSLIAFGVDSTTSHDIENIGITTKYVKTFDIYGKEGKFIAGLDHYNSEDTIASRGWSIDDILISKVSTGVYLFNELEILDDLILSTGYRTEKVDYSFDQTSPSVKYQQKNPHETIFSSKLQYNYMKDSNVYVSYEESFRFPATDEWYSIFFDEGLSESLKPQSGVQYELGVKHKFNDDLKLYATTYLMSIKDEIYYNPATANENYDKTRHKGIEAGVNYKLLDNVDTFLNLTLQEAKFKGGTNSGNDIPAVPKQMINTGCNIKLLDDLNLYIVGKYIGNRYLISDQKNQVDKLESYFTLDSKLSYSKGPWQLFLGVNNIFDKEYCEYAVTNSAGTAKNFYPSPERNFYAGVNFEF